MTGRRFLLHEELELSYALLPVIHMALPQSGLLPCSFRIVTCLLPLAMCWTLDYVSALQ